MRTTSKFSTAALVALMLVGMSSIAQESTASADTSSSGANATASSQTSTPGSANSKVRIVRLSEVKGEVQLDRKTGQGFGSAMANLPVTEGDRLKTNAGVAEVEFEDNSTVRVAPNSLIEFPQLELLPSGAKASVVNVLQGMVYVSLVNTKGNEFTVTFGQEKLNLPPDSHIRLRLAQGQASLAVLQGSALIEEPSGSTALGKNKTMTFDLASQSQPVIAKSVAEEPLDSWDHEAVEYHKSYANASSFGNSPYAYGINDMNYYGSFVNVGGCGAMWRPYFTSASWNPFANGAWAWYPGAGYSWVSPYPWGWTPYHYGNWAFCQGLGWGWQPGGSWMGLANAVPSNSTFTTRPRPPNRPPITAQSTLVPVNLKPLATSGLGPHDTFVFRSDSAGLGVPRGSLGKLNNFSNQAVQHGAVSTNVYYNGQHGAAEGLGRIASSGSASSVDPGLPSRSYSSGMQGAVSASRSAGGSGRH